MKNIISILAMVLVLSFACEASEAWHEMSLHVAYERNHVPMIRQWDPRWAMKQYGPSTYEDSACASCSFAMVASWATGKMIWPEEVAKFAEDNGHICDDGGTDVGNYFFETAAWNWSFCLIGTDDHAEVRRALSLGRPVIADHGPGLFTDGLHVLVYVGIDWEGRVIVNDPAGGDWFADDVSYSFDDVFESSTSRYFLMTP